MSPKSEALALRVSDVSGEDIASVNNAGHVGGDSAAVGEAVAIVNHSEAAKCEFVVDEVGGCTITRGLADHSYRRLHRRSALGKRQAEELLPHVESSPGTAGTIVI